MSRGTLCLIVHRILYTREYASLGCRTPGQKVREGRLALTGSVTGPPYTPRAALAVLSRTKCPRVQTLDRLSGSITFGMKERKGMAPADCSAVPAPEPCALVPKSRKEESGRARKDTRGMGFS